MSAAEDREGTADALAILRSALDRISDPARWIVGSLATDKNGTPVAPERSDACHWCAEGAFNAAASDGGWHVRPWTTLAWSALRDAAAKMGDVPHVINDRRGYEATIEMYQMAIASLQARVK